ncbi:hypothetical protein DC3_50090 [Deinococcus cellulosilyticus NBRC 106333 = KACC 11606]|uniref:Uncharacterized protein n=2 Tax=Deinococcus cellulosilyticus TaxID=401558 RepID=A0A511N969_DEIC1|nr:hypothetical protein DC3_50090 [Deinococcus cellulosilyticus NBRC 106333 = KACC 11606]
MGQDGRALALLPLMVLCTLPFGFDIVKQFQNLPPITAVVAVALIALALIPVPAQLLRPKAEGDTP